jgi:hypothetical protein
MPLHALHALHARLPDGEEAPLSSSCPCQGCRLGDHVIPATRQPAISHLGRTTYIFDAAFETLKRFHWLNPQL